MTRDRDNGKVTYSVKELLNEIRDDIRRIDEKLDRKAEAATLTAIISRIEIVASQGEEARRERDEMRKQLQNLRQESISQAAVDKYKKALWGTFGLAGIGLAWNILQGFLR